MPETIVLAPNGQEIPVVHPEGASREQILAYAKKRFDEGLDEEEKKERLNVMKYLSETPERYERTKQRYAEAFTTDSYDPTAATGQLDPILRGAAAIGTGTETVAGLAGEAYRRYAPEPVQEFVSEAYEGSLAQKAMEGIGELAQEYPTEATALEVVGNLSMLGSPAKLSVPRVSDKTLRKSKVAAFEAKNKERLERIASTVAPEDYAKAGGDFTVKGPLNKNIYIPDPTEDDVIQYLNTLDDYPASRNPVENLNSTQEHITRLEKELQAHVNKNKNPKVNLDDFSDELLDSVEEFYLDKNYRTLTETAQRQVDLFIEQTLELLTDREVKGNITARDILEIRRELDKEIFNRRPTTYIENPDVSTAKEIAGSFVRRQLNEKFLSMLPTDEAYQHLNGMSMLLKANQLLRTKSAKTVGQNAIGRTIQAVEDIAGLRFPSTPLALVATVGAGGTFLAGSPLVAGLIGASGAGYALARQTRKTRRTAILRDLLRTTDNMLKGANVTIDQVRKLRADKIMLSQMLSEVNKEEDSSE